MESLNFWVQIFTSITTSTLVIGVIIYVGKNFIIPVLIEKVRQEFEKEVESLRNEFLLAKSTYDQYLKMILEYYNNIYKFYRICQNATSYDVKSFPDGMMQFSKKEYFKNLDFFVDEYSKTEGHVRLLLPDRLMKIDVELKDAFNKFRDEIKDSIPETRESLLPHFKLIDQKIHELEAGLREFLRTEKLLK